MKKYNTTIFLLLIVFIFMSCEKTIEFKSDEIAPKIVVNAVFSAGSKYKYVRVEKSRSILNENEYFEALPDATVKLYEDDMFISELTYISKIDTFYDYLNYGVVKKYPYEGGYFIDSVSIVKSGSTYRLEVSKEGFDPVVCETTVPYPIDLNSLTMTIEAPHEEYSYQQLKCKLNLTDPKPEANYYRLQIFVTQGIELSKYYYYGYYGYGYETDTLTTDTIINVSRYDMFVNSQDPVFANSSNSDILGIDSDLYSFFTDELMGNSDYNLSFWQYLDRDVDTEIGEFIEINSSHCAEHYQRTILLFEVANAAVECHE